MKPARPLMLTTGGAGVLLAAALGVRVLTGPAAEPELPTLGPAPEFVLSDERGGRFGLEAARGKVVLVSFMFTRCTQVCTPLTARLALLQDLLPPEVARDVQFVSITLDPAHDRPEVLNAYARAMDYDPSGWRFLTGPVERIRQIARGYGVIASDPADGPVAHNALATLIDGEGLMRVQYMGDRFDLNAIGADLETLTASTAAGA